jgi:hypothetical protein
MKVRLWCLSLFAAALAPLAVAQEWPQWALNAQHNAQVGIAGQALARNIVNIVYDPLVPQEQALNDGDLLAHYQAPLVDGSDVYMMFKSGTYTLESYATQNWGETKFTWSGGTLVPAWQFATDYKAPGSAFDFWEPVFHPALANGVLYVPGAGGTVWKVNKATGTGTRINPFNSVSSSRFVTSPLTVDGSGRILYTVVQLKGGTKDWFADDVIDSFLVRISPNDSVEKVSWATLTPGTPAGNALCLNAFIEGQDALPWPPSPSAVPGSVTCGSQRPGVNASPAVAPDGTIYLISRAHLISRWGYLVAVNNNLTSKWVSSLRERFTDGCGVSVATGGSLPANGQPGGCRSGANLGVDPATNGPGGGRVLDDSSSTPVVAPDGSILYGAYSRYNYAQGHLMQFASNGSYVGAYRFGWDVTPGLYGHGGTYSVDIKDNHYSVGSYCNTEANCPSDRTASNPAYPEAYFITQLNHNLNVEWSFQNTNTLSCSRDANGNVTCVSDHPNGFEWCVNAFVVDSNGTLYANSEDGNLFAILQGGILRDKIFQQLALGAAYTPTSIGSDGKIYSQNAGHLFVAGN